MFAALIALAVPLLPSVVVARRLAAEPDFRWVAGVIVYLGVLLLSIHRLGFVELFTGRPVVTHAYALAPIAVLSLVCWALRNRIGPPLASVPSPDRERIGRLTTLTLLLVALAVVGFRSARAGPSGVASRQAATFFPSPYAC